MTENAVRHTLPPTLTPSTVTQKIDGVQNEKEMQQNTPCLQPTTSFGLAQKIDSTESWMTAARCALHSSTYSFGLTRQSSHLRETRAARCALHLKRYFSGSHTDDQHILSGHQKQNAPCILPNPSAHLHQRLRSHATTRMFTDACLCTKGSKASQRQKSSKAQSTFPKHSFLVPQHLWSRAVMGRFARFKIPKKHCFFLLTIHMTYPQYMQSCPCTESAAQDCAWKAKLVLKLTVWHAIVQEFAPAGAKMGFRKTPIIPWVPQMTTMNSTDSGLRLPGCRER